MRVKTIKHNLQTIFFIGLLLILTDCIYEYPDCKSPGRESELTILYDMSAVGSAPQGMTALLYPEHSGDYWQYEVPISGATVDIDSGTYRAVTYNNDTEAILFHGFNSISTLEVYTRSAQVTDGFKSIYSGTKPPLGRDESMPVVISPDMLWSESIPKDINIPSCRSITFSPRPIVADYKIIVDNINNLNSVREGSVSISGLCGNYYIGLNKKGDNIVTVPGAWRHREKNHERKSADSGMRLPAPAH